MNTFFKYVYVILCIAVRASAYAQSLPQESNADYIQTMSVNKTVASKGNFTNSLPLDSSASLPIGIYKQIGQSTYIIAIDSAKFLPGGASCSAFMAIGLPGMADSLAFAAKNIGINPKGVLAGGVGNSKLMLVSTHRIRVSSKITLVLKNDGTNYVEWNCNGFQAINLKGYFEFSGTMLEPDNPNSTDSTVTASFEVHTNDIHNMVMTVNISPFKLKGATDISFSVTNAVADFSELANSPTMAFPAGYQLSDPNPLMWTGFFIKNFTVKLPQELSGKNQPRTTIQATNLIIDNTGVSGNFSANNILSVGNSDMGGWHFSIDQLGVSLVQNHITAGSISGNIDLPIFDNNSLNYTASIYENPTTKEVEYTFIASPKNNININALSATIDIYNTSQIQITKANHKLKPLAFLNGQIKFDHNNIKTAKLDFINLKIEDTAPYLTQGVFNFVGATDNKSMNFPISINSIQLILNQSAPIISFSVGLNFMDASNQGFAAVVGINVKTKTTANTLDITHPKLEFDKVVVENIYLDINTQAFGLKGLIQHMESHPVYGDALVGTMTLTLPHPATSITFDGLFGALPTYKYFYIDGRVIFPTAISITPNIKIKGLLGGLYYHMNKNVDYVASMQMQNSVGPVGVYLPDATKGIGFKAGGTLFYTSEEAFNADMVLEMTFNSSQNGGGLAFMQFTGDAFSMISIANRQGKRYNQVPVGASGSISYDFNANILHATLNVGVNIPPEISANICCAAHFESALWYVAIGRPTNKGIVTVNGFGSIAAYFMVGSQIDPPVMPQNIAQYFGNPFSRSATDLATGQGFCMGAELARAQGGDFGFSFFDIYYLLNYGVGFDVMMTKVSPGYLCPNTGDTPGFKGYYVEGSIYAYINASVGVRGNIDILGIKKDFDFNILSATAAAMLYGQLVRPTYIEGDVYASYNILSVVSGNVNFSFKAGTKCSG